MIGSLEATVVSSGFTDVRVRTGNLCGENDSCFKETSFKNNLTNLQQEHRSQNPGDPWRPPDSASADKLPRTNWRFFICDPVHCLLSSYITHVLYHFLLDFHLFSVTTAAVSHRNTRFNVPRTLPCFKAFLLQRLPDPRAVTVGSESLEKLLLGKLERRGCHLGLAVGG